ncbi:putative Ig domain-containing protein [Roseateles sp. P5_E7]
MGTLSGSYDVNVSAELLVPTTVTAVTPSLPAGLRCNRASGTLPPGMTLSADCALSGTASESGRFVSQLTVTAPGYSGSASVAFSVQVEGPYLSLVEPDNPRMLSAIDGNGNATLRNQGLFTVRPGDKTVYSVTAGRLPSGVTLDPATGNFTGIPFEMGKFNVTVGATFERNGGRATLTVVSRDFYVLEPSINFSYYQSFINPIDLGPIQPAVPQLLGSLGPLRAARFEFIGSPPTGFTIDSTTGVISGSAEAPGTGALAVRVFLADGNGAQYPVDTRPIDISVRGVLPTYHPLDCIPTCFAPYRSENIYSTIATITLAPLSMYQGRVGDVYTYEILPPTDGRKLPSWVSVAANTGVVTIKPTTSGDYGPYGMILKVTTLRNGKSMSSLQRWDFSVNF